MMRSVFVLVVSALLVPSAHATGLLKKIPAALDPTKAYVIVELSQMDGAMMPGTLTIARYDSQNRDIAAPTPRVEGANKGSKYVLDNRLFFNKHLIKNKDRRLMIGEVKPGLWVIEGANDTAFSLGSSTMQLEPGSVTDLGVAWIYSDFPEGEKRDIATTGRALRGALMGGLFGSVLPKPMPRAVDFRLRGASDMQLPPLLAANAQPVLWTGEVRFGNFLGGMVNRMGGIKARPGVDSGVKTAPESVATGAVVPPTPAP